MKRKAAVLAKRITQELFERDSKPGSQMPQLLGGDLVDPNRDGIETTIREVLESDPYAWEDQFWREVGPQP